jgi:hypothetical protein
MERTGSIVKLSLCMPSKRMVGGGGGTYHPSHSTPRQQMNIKGQRKAPDALTRGKQRKIPTISGIKTTITHGSPSAAKLVKINCPIIK